MGKRWPLQYLVLGTLDSYTQENETGLLSNSIDKSKLEMDQRPECKSQKHKTLRRKHRQNCLEYKHEQLFHEHNEQLFHEHISLGKGNKSKSEQVGLHQTKIFCTAKDTIRRMKSHPTVWENIFIKDISDMG